jgi:hypothetical protein
LAPPASSPPLAPLTGTRHSTQSAQAR